MVGAGSVGGAAVYALACVPELSGSLTIVDPENLESKNPDRALLATAEAADAGESKVLVAAQALEHLSGLAVDPHQEAIADFVARRGRADTLPLVLSAVDSAESRRSIQDCLPLQVVNAACSPDEATVSGHVTGAGPCVCCLHMPDVLDEDQIRWRLISKATDWNREQVVTFLI